MAKFKITSDASVLVKAFGDKQGNIAEAAVAALRETTADAVQEGRQNIAASGRFGPKWQQGLQYVTKGATEGGEPSLQAQTIIFHNIGYAGVFEFGATIQGKPLLWIPTTRGAPSPKRSGKKLTSATVRGRPMLFDANDRDPHRKPLYIGVRSVRIRKLWNIVEIAKRHADQIATVFLKHFKDD
jgi:hypothetical protein